MVFLFSNKWIANIIEIISDRIRLTAIACIIQPVRIYTNFAVHPITLISDALVRKR